LYGLSAVRRQHDPPDSALRPSRTVGEFGGIELIQQLGNCRLLQAKRLLQFALSDRPLPTHLKQDEYLDECHSREVLPKMTVIDLMELV
jgi:hypothetical protein